jgi:hypothetical protein
MKIVTYAMSEPKRPVKLDIYVMFARNRPEPNAVEIQIGRFLRDSKAPRGIRID